MKHRLRDILIAYSLIPVALVYFCIYRKALRINSLT